ncbi:MAG: hypothetical protein A2Y07_11125 [Planctomycetes bacterium GWF2_50_10]|nr:MAG: hypothetical protein A2Y07_11125 [Planctomycetes bacterium GWF2_50_10]
MSKFPAGEAQIYALASKMVMGFRRNQPIFHKPPVNWIMLNFRADMLRAKIVGAKFAIAKARAAQRQKDAALDTLIKALKQNIAYAQLTASGDGAKLAAIGWGLRALPKQASIPSQPTELCGQILNNGFISLSWQKPADGTRPSIYNIYCRQCGQDQWCFAGTALDETFTTQKDQGGSFEFYVAAQNKAGTSPSSNIAAVIL